MERQLLRHTAINTAALANGFLITALQQKDIVSIKALKLARIHVIDAIQQLNVLMTEEQMLQISQEHASGREQMMTDIVWQTLERVLKFAGMEKMTIAIIL